MSDLARQLRTHLRYRTGGRIDLHIANPLSGCLVAKVADHVEALEAELAGVHGGTHCIVPVEATNDMLLAGLNSLDKAKNTTALFSSEVLAAYRAMLTASQEQDKS